MSTEPGQLQNTTGTLSRVTDRGAGTGGVQYVCYAYDSLDRLTAAHTSPSSDGGSGCGAYQNSGMAPFNSGWSYNSVGNITTASGLGTPGGAYAYGAGAAGPHAVTSVPGNTYGYNARGDQTVRNIGGQTTTLAYDHQGRLTGLSGAETASYRYDTAGRRGVVTAGGVTRWIVDEVYVAGSDGSEQVTYRLGGQTVATSSGTTTGDNTLTVYTAGQLGSLEGQVSATGVVTRQTYTPFGTPRTATGANILAGERSYTDQIDDSTGLMYYRARYYDPTLGRFTQPDTLIPNPTDSQDHNRYTYVRNNPVNLNDPTGRCFEPLTGSLMPYPECVWTPSGDPIYGHLILPPDLRGRNTLADLVSRSPWVYEDPPSRIDVFAAIVAEAIVQQLPGYDCVDGLANGWGWGNLAGCSLDVAGAGAAVHAARSATKGAEAIEVVEEGTQLLKHADDIIPASTVSGRARARQLGVEGEALAGIDPNVVKTRIPSLTGSANYWVPDALTDSVLTEVKSVQRLGYTSQIEDFSYYATQTGRRLDLVVRESTVLTRELQDIVNMTGSPVNLIRGLPAR